ncbi:MAG: class I SAM-dependent methyltransferase [Desulfobacterales bacterium]|nr:class I SAM-dependent methyltransferase [Desulfobacterales bacterium]
MNITDIIEANKKPDIYTPGTAIMWTDDHISKQLLDVHLSQDTDLASRKTPAIESTVNWILGRVPENPLDILDLGCGPGLYTERLAQRGHRVTGVDFSSGSIAHAKASAREKGLGITYLNRDYLTLDSEERYDLVMMIFTDFGVLAPDDRCSLLKKIHNALRPDGIFIFDVLNTGWNSQPRPGSWETSESGFWRPCPHLVLNRGFYYETEGVALDQHIVLDDKGIEVYRFYIHTFSHGDIETLAADHGFQSAACTDGLIPAGELYRSEDLTFCVIRK